MPLIYTGSMDGQEENPGSVSLGQQFSKCIPQTNGSIQCHLGVCQKCRRSDYPLDLLNEKLWRRSPGTWVSSSPPGGSDTHSSSRTTGVRYLVGWGPLGNSLFLHSIYSQNLRGQGLSRTVKGPRFCPPFRLTSYPATVSQMLAEDLRLMGQRLKDFITHSTA